MERAERRPTGDKHQACYSFSGKERNRLFYNRDKDGTRSFVDLSTLSGMDSPADGRGFAIWDFNRDGQTDIALCNSNAPHLNLFENQLETDHQFLAIRFIGGASEDQPGGFSSRDGYGAVVTLETNGGLKMKREFRCGEGFATQNSDTLLIGIGNSDVVDLHVRWPSGITYSARNLAGGRLITLVENESNSPTHKSEKYLKR